MVCPALAFGVLVLSWMQPAAAAIEFIASSSAQNDGLPTNGSAGALTIPRPVGISAGQALIASIAARPRSMTVTVPSGWVLMTSTQQTNGGTSTAPGGMNALTYYKIVTTSEPASYTWTFANPSNQGAARWAAFQVLRNPAPPAAAPACFGTSSFTAAGLSSYTITVSCTRTTGTDVATALTFYQLLPTSCNVPTSGACPNTSAAPQTTYVERQLMWTVMR